MGTAWETLHLKAAYCTSYVERFVHGDVSSGSYRCFFALSDPDGWIWYPGGLPEEAAIRPAAREHGVPLVAAAAGASRAGAGAKKTALVASTAEHKAARWAQYQSKKAGRPGAWSEARWSK